MFVDKLVRLWNIWKGRICYINIRFRTQLYSNRFWQGAPLYPHPTWGPHGSSVGWVTIRPYLQFPTNRPSGRTEIEERQVRQSPAENTQAFIQCNSQRPLLQYNLSYRSTTNFQQNNILHLVVVTDVAKWLDEENTRYATCTKKTSKENSKYLFSYITFVLLLTLSHYCCANSQFNMTLYLYGSVNCVVLTDVELAHINNMAHIFTCMKLNRWSNLEETIMHALCIRYQPKSQKITLSTNQSRLFLVQFLYKIMSQVQSFLFWIRLSQGLGKQNRFQIGCDVFRVKAFVSLCSHSTGGCMRGSKRMGIETVAKNNGERIMKKLWFRGGV